MANKNNANNSEPQSTKKTYEEWKVRLQEDGTFKKLEDCIRTVKLEPRIADKLNEQSHNSRFRYFEVA